MITSEFALLDTNILVYAADETSEFHAPAKQLRDRGVQGDIPRLRDKTSLIVRWWQPCRPTG